MKVDLNSDLGESFGAYTIGMDKEVIPLVTSANIACGFHAGDPAVMQKTIALAHENRIGLGLIPVIPTLSASAVGPWPSVLRTFMHGGLSSGCPGCFCQGGWWTAAACQTPWSHVQYGGQGCCPSRSHCPAVYDVDKDLILFAQPGTESIKAAEKIGLLTAAEVFADRSYQEDGTLTPRSKPGAMITDEDASIAQVLSMVLDHKVTCLSGKVIPIKADSICVHGDGPKALLFVQKIRKALAEKGVEIAPAGSFLR